MAKSATQSQAETVTGYTHGIRTSTFTNASYASYDLSTWAGRFVDIYASEAYLAVWMAEADAAETPVETAATPTEFVVHDFPSGNRSFFVHPGRTRLKIKASTGTTNTLSIAPSSEPVQTL